MTTGAVVAVAGKSTATDNVVKQEPARRRLEQRMLMAW